VIAEITQKQQKQQPRYKNSYLLSRWRKEIIIRRRQSYSNLSLEDVGGAEV
jgi:hypothetical protein